MQERTNKSTPKHLGPNYNHNLAPENAEHDNVAPKNTEGAVSDLKSSDFLTPGTANTNNVGNAGPVGPPPMPLQPGLMNPLPEMDVFPDIHGDDNLVPNLAQKNDIKNDITPDKISLGKEDLINDAIQRDIEEAKLKHMGIKKDPKDILKNMIAKGEYQESFDLYGCKWTFRALDQNDYMMALDDVRDSLESYIGRLSANMFAQVVYALEAINDKPIYQWFPEIKLETYGGNKQEYILACKIALKQYLGALPPSIIDALHDKYEEVNKKRNEAIDELKNS